MTSPLIADGADAQDDCGKHGDRSRKRDPSAKGGPELGRPWNGVHPLVLLTKHLHLVNGHLVQEHWVHARLLFA
jgi:hypothetical protein